MWALPQSWTKPARPSRPGSSWQFSVAQRPLLWLGVILLVLAQCALSMSLPSFPATETTSPSFAVISKASAAQASVLRPTMADDIKACLTGSKSACESKR